MGLKEQLNEKPALAIGAAAALLLVAAALAYLVGGVGNAGAGSGGQAFFSVDDGKTYFPASTANIAPFDHNGKQAVRAYVFEAGGKKFVNHLERFTPSGKKAMQERAEALAAGKPPPPPVYGGGMVEIKRPGESAWVALDDKAKAGPILSVKAAGVAPGTATPVEP